MPDDTPIFHQSFDEMRQPMEASPSDIDDPETFEDGMVLRLEVRRSSAPILVTLVAETVLGRRDPTKDEKPDLDLSPYAAHQMGISRRHATLRLSEKRLEVWDMGSKNGTAVNGRKLDPFQACPVKHGDELRLGKMYVKLYFQAKNTP